MSRIATSMATTGIRRFFRERGAVITIAAMSAALVTPALGLDYSGTCRGPGATIVNIEGLDTARARAVAKHTVPDAIAYCHYILGYAQNRPSPGARELRACVDDFMRTSGRETLTAEANCRAGSLVLGGSATEKHAYRFPIAISCAGGGDLPVRLFRLLCPTYSGKIEEEP